MNVKSKFRFKQVVKHTLKDDKFFIVDGIAIYSSGTILYACLDSDGNVKWFKDFEIVGEKQKGPLGFNININNVKAKS